MTNNLNPFSLDRELADKNKHEMIYMLWKKSTPQKFYKHICNGMTVLQPRVPEVITDFMQESKENYQDLRITCLATRTFSSMYTQMSSQRFLAPQNDPVFI